MAFWKVVVEDLIQWRWLPNLGLVFVLPVITFLIAEPRYEEAHHVDFDQLGGLYAVSTAFAVGLGSVVVVEVAIWTKRLVVFLKRR